jgi:hypothetical protein
MSNDQSFSQDNNTASPNVQGLSDGKIDPVRSSEYRPQVSVAELKAQIESENPNENVPNAKVIDPDRVYGFQDIRKNESTIAPIDRAPGDEVRLQDVIEQIRAKNYPEGQGKAPPLNGEGKIEKAELDDKGVLTIKGEGNLRDQELYKIEQRYKFDATFQTEALPQNDSELNKLRPGYKLPLDVKDIGNGGTLNTLDAKFEQRLGENTLGNITTKINGADKTTVFGVGVENEVSGSKANLEAGFKQVGDITQLTQLKFSGEHHTLKGGMVGATAELNFLPETGKFNGYDVSANLRPDGSFTTYKIGVSENIAENLKKFNIGAKSDSGTSLEISTSTQTTGNEIESKKVENQKLAFETKIYGGLEPIKKGQDKHDPLNLREDGTLSVSAEKTTTTTKKPDPQVDDGSQKTEVSQEVKLAAGYKSTAGTEIGGDITIKDGTVEEANASLKTPVFTTKHPKPGEKDEDGELKKPVLEKQGDISVSGTYKNTQAEKSLEVATGYESVGGTGISGKVKTNTETGQLISASGKLVSEVQDLKGKPDQDGKYKKIGTMTLEGSYDAPKKEATGKFDVAMDDTTGFKVGATVATDTGKLKKIDGETSFFIDGGTKILLGGNANFVDKTLGGKLEITAPKDEGSLKLDATFKNIEGKYELQKFTGSVQGKDKDGNITKIEGAIDNEAKTASAKIGYTDGGTKHTYGGYANFKDQKISEAGLTFEGKVGDPKMAQSDLKVGVAATFKDGRLDGGKVNVSLTPDNAPLNPKYHNHDTYFVGKDNVARVMNIGRTPDPEVRQAATAERVAKLEPTKDKPLYEQAVKAVQDLNEAKKLNLPVAETAASLFELAKTNKLPDIAKAVDGTWVPGGSNIFIMSSTGQRAEMKLNDAVNTNDQLRFDQVDRINAEAKKAQATTQTADKIEQDQPRIAATK